MKKRDGMREGGEERRMVMVGVYCRKRKLDVKSSEERVGGDGVRTREGRA